MTYLFVPILVLVFGAGISMYLKMILETVKHGLVDSGKGKIEGKIVIITGGNSGLGFGSAEYLAKNHVKLILACRSVERGQNAKEKILQDVKDAEIDVMPLSLDSFRSIKNFADSFIKKYGELDVLVNNAGTVLRIFHKAINRTKVV